jgi:nitrile hydratase accessory protein
MGAAPGVRFVTNNLSELPLLPADENGPVFDEPWQAQAFALALTLHEAGCYTWEEWARVLSEEIGRAQAAGDDDLGDTYYLHWLNALERLCVDRTGLTPAQLIERKARWRSAYLNTPHGSPVELSAAD